MDRRPRQIERGLKLPWTCAGAVVAALALTALALGNAGELDPAFDGDGKVTTDFGASQDQALAAALQPDGKIVAAGFSDASGNRDFALARYNADGSRDVTFGAGGLVTTDFGLNLTDEAWAVTILADGKILAAGFSQRHATGNLDFALARYNADGSLDPTFGSGGLVHTDFVVPLQGSGNDNIAAIAIHADGKIVAAGTSTISAQFVFALARYNPDGSLDPTFGSGGTLTTDIRPGSDQGRAVALQSDGQIIVAGFNQGGPGTSVDFALARYNPDGSLDAKFGSGGIVTTDFASGSDLSLAVVLEADGKIVAGGGAEVAGSTNFALARYNVDGSLDPTFGTGGLVTTAISSRLDFITGLALQADGKLVAAGRVEPPSGTEVFGLARYKTDGSLDAGFGSGGTVTSDFGGTDIAFAVLIQADGKIVAAGQSNQAGTDDFALARYLADAVNQPPVATADAYAVDEDTALAVPAPGVLANDSDPNGDALTAALVAGPSHGTLTLNADGSFTYTPNPNFNGSDGFTYTAGDGQAQSIQATVSIAVTPVNDPPDAVDDTASTGRNRPVVIAVLKNDTDVDGDPLSIGTVTSPAHGTARIDAGETVTYTPERGFIGPDGFTYTANDRQGASDKASVVVDVRRRPGALADLSVDVTGPRSARVGQAVRYNIVVSNRGPDAVRDARVQISLRGTVTLLQASTSLGSCAGSGPIFCQIGALAQSESASLLVIVVVRPARAGAIVGATARVSSFSARDPTLRNNSDSATTQIGSRPRGRRFR